jgi:hypothetical protein
MQAREIVKANNLTDQIVVIHGRVEVRLSFYVYAQLMLIAFFNMCCRVGNLALLFFHV